jgi:hypothetical protein
MEFFLPRHAIKIHTANSDTSFNCPIGLTGFFTLASMRMAYVFRAVFTAAYNIIHINLLFKI